MTKALKPALTPEQWAILAPIMDDVADAMVHEIPNAIILDDEDINSSAAVMAIANAELPADSPYKITRADVDYLLNDVALALENEDVWRSPDAPGESPARTLAAKISALLPP